MSFPTAFLSLCFFGVTTGISIGGAVVETIHSFGAATNGIIGLSAAVLDTLGTVYVPTGRFGCEWIGRGPWCYGDCDTDQDDYSLEDKIEKVYGASCFVGTKSWCCRPNGNDNTWTGIWFSGATANSFNCKYFQHATRTLDKHNDSSFNCGFLECSPQYRENLPVMEFQMIQGEWCNDITMFQMRGKAFPGFIVWTNLNGTEEVDWWYK